MSSLFRYAKPCIFDSKYVVFLLVCFLFPKSLQLKHRSKKCIVAQHDLIADRSVLIFIYYSLPKPLQHAHTHTHTKLRKCNHVTSLSRFWEFAVHSSGDMRGVEKPSFHLTGGGLTTSLKVSSAFSSTPITLFIQMHGQPRFLVCLFEGGTVNNRAHWEVHSGWTLNRYSRACSCMWAVSWRR